MMSTEQKNASELMPKSPEALKILQARTKQLAKEEVDASQNNGIHFVRFLLGQKESYGIPYQYVQEVLNCSVIAKPPFVPHFIAGVINWRGALITLVDLFQFFHLDHSLPTKQYENKFIIVIQANNITLGFLVYHMEGSDIYLPNHLAAPISSSKATNPEFILGLHQSVTAIIHMESLIVHLNQEIKRRLYKIGEVHGE